MIRIIGLLVIWLIAVAAGAWFLFPSLFAGGKNPTTSYAIPIKVGSASFSVEIANTYYSRAQGLSGRAPFDDSRGMLFVFPSPNDYSFWMRGMKFPIDIVWIDESKRVVYISPDISPNTYPTSFNPNQAVKYVLEINAGSAKRNNIHIGDMVYYNE